MCPFIYLFLRPQAAQLTAAIVGIALKLNNEAKQQLIYKDYTNV